MARRRREWAEGAIYHVFSRGSNRQAIFLNDGDYVEFEMLLGVALRKHQLDCFGWSFMPNHWHGVVRCPSEGLSRFMKAVNHRYAMRFDRRWGRTAHLFGNRFGAVLQTTEEQLLGTLRYVVRNPVEAGICASRSTLDGRAFPRPPGSSRRRTICVSTRSSSGSDTTETARAGTTLSSSSGTLRGKRGRIGSRPALRPSRPDQNGRAC